MLKAILLIGFLALWVLAVLSSISRARIDRGAQLEAARKQFKDVRIQSSSPSLVLNGSTAEVLKEEELGNTPRSSEHDYVLTVYARNEFGEYFMFRSGTPKPFVKHMEHRAARTLLKEKYVPHTYSKHWSDIYSAINSGGVLIY